MALGYAVMRPLSGEGSHELAALASELILIGADVGVKQAQAMALGYAVTRPLSGGFVLHRGEGHHERA